MANDLTSIDEGDFWERKESNGEEESGKNNIEENRWRDLDGRLRKVEKIIRIAFGLFMACAGIGSCCRKNTESE